MNQTMQSTVQVMSQQAAEAYIVANPAIQAAQWNELPPFFGVNGAGYPRGGCGSTGEPVNIGIAHV